MLIVRIEMMRLEITESQFAKMIVFTLGKGAGRPCLTWQYVFNEAVGETCAPEQLYSKIAYNHKPAP